MAADADVDDGLDGPARGALPLLRADPAGEGAHLVEHGVHVCHDVLAVDHQPRPAGHAQRDVQHGAVLADVDVLAAEHGRDPLAQPGPLGQGQQQVDRLARGAVLGVVEVEVAGGRRHAVGAARIIREQLAELFARQLAVVLVEGRPLLAPGDVAVHALPPRVAKPITIVP
jgi:hypothetical protein